MAVGQNYQNLDYHSPSSPGQWGGGAFALVYRDPLDAARSARGNRIPSAEYPDGYLGNIRQRREDRLLKTLGNRVNERGYQRGVHKGDRIDASDYFWPPYGPVSLTAGLEAQARGEKWTAQGGTSVERFVAGGPYARDAGRQLLGGVIEGAPTVDPDRARSVRRLMPAWSAVSNVGLGPR